jgi:heme-degrading monooxygenase HmoA
LNPALNAIATVPGFGEVDDRMVRIVYTWRVQKADESKFRAEWVKARTAIKNSTVGARGSFLLRSHQDPTKFITIARWDKLEDWRAYWEDSTRIEMQVMHTLAKRLSAEVYDEIEDHTI